MAGGSALIKGGSSYRSFYSAVDLQTYKVSSSKIDNFINVMASDIDTDFPYSLATHKQSVKDSLEMISLLEAYQDGDAQKLVTDVFYKRGNGRISCYLFSFHPITEKTIQAETFRLSVSLRLADDAIILHQEKKYPLWIKRKWDEVQVIPATIKSNDIIDALSIALAPLVQNKYSSTPTGVISTLKEAARASNSDIPSDSIRRTLYDPTTDVSVVVEDPEFLRMMEPVAIKASGEF